MQPSFKVEKKRVDYEEEIRETYYKNDDLRTPLIDKTTTKVESYKP